MIVMMSLWRNDADRRLDARVAHLRAKGARDHAVRWLWTVGDSHDDTYARLVGLADDRVTVLRFDSGIPGEDVQASRLRTSWTASQMFQHLRDTDDLACLHESDLVSPPDVLDRLIANPLPAAGWPTIKLNGDTLFYDVWAYRDLQGKHFSAGRTATAPFEVGSFGSCWMAPAALVRNRVIGEECVVDLCRQWRSAGVSLWVDPSIAIDQPVDLWEAR